jgi:hypothetical protein
MFYGTKGLTRELTVEQAESDFAIRLEGFGDEPIPFGFLHPEWQKLKKKMKPGDRLWEFEGEGARHRHVGVKLIRDGKVIDSIVARTIETKLPERRGQR